MFSRESTTARIIAGPAVLGAQSSAKRTFSCAECHRHFKSKLELYWHAEECLLEAFENEAISVLSDISTSKTRFSNSTTKPATPVGITVKTAGIPSRQEYVKLKVGADHSINMKSDTISNNSSTERQICNKPFTYTSTGEYVRDAQTIEGPGGLRLMVSVEKDVEESPEPPPDLRSEVGHEFEDGGRESVEEEEVQDDDDIEDDEDIPPGTSFNPMNIPQVIGALANANDDPYKPKMECPTCGLVLYRHNFATHYRIHTGELPYVCNFCAKRFRTTSSLKVHVRAHTGEKPYCCPSCTYATITKRNLDRHIVNHHVRQGRAKGPMTRKSRYRDNVDVDWMDLDSLQHGGQQDHQYLEEHLSEDHRTVEVKVQEPDPDDLVNADGLVDNSTS